MTPELILGGVGALLLTLLAVSLFVSRRRRLLAAPAPNQVRHIRIRGDYQPSEVHVRAGERARLVFRREETAPCSECVVFPDLGMSVMLPPFQDVAVDLPASDPGEHEFTCQMQMLRGRVVVDGERAAS